MMKEATRLMKEIGQRECKMVKELNIQASKESLLENGKMVLKKVRVSIFIMMKVFLMLENGRIINPMVLELENLPKIRLKFMLGNLRMDNMKEKVSFII